MTSAAISRARLLERMRSRHERQPRTDALTELDPTPGFPTDALHGYLSGLMELSRRIRRTLLAEVTPHIEQIAQEGQRHDAAPRMRIGITGGPGVGKTTLATELAARHGLPLTHSDDLIALGWSEASAHVADAMQLAHSGIFEGVALARALRKSLEASPDRPLEILLVLRRPLRQLSPGQAAMLRAHDTVIAPLLNELQRRGVRIVQASADQTPDDLASIVAADPRMSLARMQLRIDASPALERYVRRARGALVYDVAPHAQRAALRVADQTRRTLNEQLARALAPHAGTRATPAPPHHLHNRDSRFDARKRPTGTVGTVGTVNPFAADSGIAKRLEAFIAAQTKRTGSMTDATYAQVQASVRAGLEQGLRPKDLAAKIIRDTGKVSENAAVVVANDAVGILHAKFTELRQTDLGITHYRWRTAGDVKVRPGHRALDGSVQAWNDPPVTNPQTGKKAHPGFDTHYFACRCQAIPIIDPATIQIPTGSPLATTPQPPPGATGQVPIPGLGLPSSKPPVRGEVPFPPPRPLPPPAPTPPAPPPPAPAPPTIPAPTPPTPPWTPPPPPPPWVPPPGVTSVFTTTTAPPTSGPAVSLIVKIPAPAPAPGAAPPTSLSTPHVFPGAQPHVTLPPSPTVRTGPLPIKPATDRTIYDAAVRKTVANIGPAPIRLGPIQDANLDTYRVIASATNSNTARLAHYWADAWVGNSTKYGADKFIDGIADESHFAHAMYESTQALFREKMAELQALGVVDADGYLHVFRGVKNKQATALDRALNKSEFAKLKVHSVSSWSASHRVARRFARKDGVVAQQRVHFSRVIAAHFWEQPWKLAEFEFALAAPEESFIVSRADETLPDAYRPPP